MLIARFLSITFLVGLTACGGGGGASGPVTSSNSFDIRAGSARLIANGATTTLTISGTCSGTFLQTNGAATTRTTFEGSSALSGDFVFTANYSNCAPATSSGTTTLYYDTNFVQIGYDSGSGGYGIWSATELLPTAAKVGDVGIVGIINKYRNSTKSTYTGKQEISYVIEPDTDTTAIANLIYKTYNTSNALTSTEQDRYRVAADGSLSLISKDIQNATGSNSRFIMN